MDAWLDPSICVRLAITLGHFLWQATAIALVAGMASVLLRKAASRVRYGLFVLALLIMAACPLLIRRSPPPNMPFYRTAPTEPTNR